MGWTAGVEKTIVEEDDFNEDQHQSRGDESAPPDAIASNRPANDALPTIGKARQE